MNGRKKIMLFLFIGLCFLLISPTTIHAEEINKDEITSEEWQQTQDDLLKSSGADELFNQLPKEAQGFFEEHNLDTLDSQVLLDLSGGDFLSLIGKSVLAKLQEPLSILAMLLGIVLLASLLGSFEQTLSRSGMNRAFELVCVLCISAIVVTPIMAIVKNTIALLSEIGNFLLGFIPVYAGIISVSGKPISAFTYHSMLVGIVEVVNVIATSFLIPLCSIYLAFCICGSINGFVKIDGISKTIKTVLTWTLGLFITVFVAILTIKSFVAGAADSVTLRTGKFVVGSFVPVVGSALADALTVIQGSVGVIRSAVGAFGILAVIICFLPSLVSILLMSVAVKIAQLVGRVLAVEKVSTLLEATGFVLSFLQSILISYGVMLVVAISLMLVLGLGS